MATVKSVDAIKLGKAIKNCRTKVAGGRDIRTFADFAGCSTNMLLSIENGRRTPSLKLLKGIAEAAHTTASAILAEAETL